MPATCRGMALRLQARQRDVPLPRNTVPKVREEPDQSADFEHVLPGLEPDRALAVLRRTESLLRVPDKESSVSVVTP